MFPAHLIGLLGETLRRRSETERHILGCTADSYSDVVITGIDVLMIRFQILLAFVGLDILLAVGVGLDVAKANLNTTNKQFYGASSRLSSVVTNTHALTALFAGASARTFSCLTLMGAEGIAAAKAATLTVHTRV